MDAKRLAEIEKRHANAQFGYEAVTCQMYWKDVGALLAEIKCLQSSAYGPNATVVPMKVVHTPTVKEVKAAHTPEGTKRG